jgi:P pilus assembly chaperone PapD
MKRIALFFCFIFSFAAHANNIIVNGTRFIYPGNEKEITVQLSNNADRPALAQAWLDNGDADATPDTITTRLLSPRRFRALTPRAARRCVLSSVAAPVWRKIKRRCGG